MYLNGRHGAVPANLRRGSRGPGAAAIGEPDNLGRRMSRGEGGFSYGCGGGGYCYGVLVSVQGGGGGGVRRVGGGGVDGTGLGLIVVLGETPPLLLLNRRRSGGPFWAEESPEKAHVSLLRWAEKGVYVREVGESM